MAIRDPKVRSAVSVILSRAMYAQRAGITFRGQRDLYTALGYARILRPEDYRSRYMRGGIAARVVEALPKATWRGGVEVLEDEDPKTITDFEQTFLDFAQRVKLWAQFTKADILAGLGQFSIMLIGAPGNLQDPLPDKLSIDDIQYLAPYSQQDVLIQLIDTNTVSPRFGLPEQYLIRRLAGQQYLGAAVGTRLVHWSRVVHFADEALDDRVYGHPRLERVWNLLDDLEKLTGAGAEAFWKRADQGIVFDMDPELEWDSGEVAAVNAAADEFAHGYRRLLTTRGMKMQQLGSDVANFNQQVDAIITLIAGATGTPKRILVGSERGELASTQDRENWEQRVSDRRGDYGEQIVLRPFLDRLIEHGALPEPSELIIRWPEIEYLNETEKSTIAVALSNVNKNIGGVVVTPSEIRDRVLGWEKLEEHQIPSPDGWAPHVPYLAPPLNRIPTGSELQPWADQPWEPRARNEITGQPNPAGDRADSDQLQPPPPQYPLVQQASRRALSTKSKVAEDLRGSFHFHARRALRHAKKAHSKALVKSAALRGKHDVIAAMHAPVNKLREGLRRMATIVGEAHHLTHAATRAACSPRMAARQRNVDVSQESQQYAIDQITSLTTNLDAEARDRISSLAETAFEKGWNADKLSTRLEESIGLNDVQAGAVENLRTRLEEGNPGDVVDFGDRSARIPRDGGSDEWIDKQASRYSDDLLAQRADTIAEDLLSAAQNEGQRAGWEAALEDGDLAEGTERVWRAGADACPDCKDMDGETAAIGEQYEGPDGPIDGPGLHSHCECDEELFEPKRAASVSDRILAKIKDLLLWRIA